MKTRLSKLLVLFLLICSVGFMGFSMVTAFGGPNWEIKARELTEYSFELDRPGGTWTVKTRGLSEDKVGSSKALAGAYNIALKHRNQVQKQELDKLQSQIDSTQKRLDQFVDLVKKDVPALKERHDFLNQEIIKINAENKAAAADEVVKSREVQQIYEVIRNRREETQRMHSQLEELRSERTAILEEKRRLQDLLNQAIGNLERAKRRYELLKDDVGTEHQN